MEVDDIAPCAEGGGTIHLIEDASVEGGGVEVGIGESYEEKQRHQEVKPLLPVPLLILLVGLYRRLFHILWSII